jgi:hypothetical protein
MAILISTPNACTEGDSAPGAEWFSSRIRVLAGEVHTHELARLQHDLKIVPLRALKCNPSRHSFRTEHENSPWRV